MDRQAALILSIISFIIFSIITYYGTKITIWSSIIFSIFVSLILLNIFYPPSKATTDSANFSLVIYAIIELGGIILLAIYIAQKTLVDVRD